MKASPLGPKAVLIVGLALGILIYLPGLSGSFVYDDFYFFVQNAAVHVDSLSLSDWAAAADSFPAPHQGRWLGMLSFAANYFVDGLDPWGYKLVNLLIHLVNGCLVAAVAQATLKMRRLLNPIVGGTVVTDQWYSSLIALAWLVLPINLTAVLYVAQRLESLSNTFVLLGLYGYLEFRIRDWQMRRVGGRLIVALGACTAVGALVKESAVLLPLYAACFEVVFFGFKRQDRSLSRVTVALFSATLVVPLIAGAFWLLSWVNTDQAYSRPFTTLERVMTQARVLFDYMRWTLLPNLSELTLYHDDVKISEGLLNPWTTLPAIIGVIVLAAWAIVLRRTKPIFAIGILLFFAGHALTSTVIPLMLAFEHRNYFASFGLVLCCASLVGLEFSILRPRVQWVSFCAYLLFLSGTTHLRALEWSNPVRLAASEASKRPLSVNAQYDYAQTLVRVADVVSDGKLVELALAHARSKKTMPDSGILFESLIVSIDARRGNAEEPELWGSMIRKAWSAPARASDVNAINVLCACMRTGVCPQRYDALFEVVKGFVSHPKVDANLYSVQGILLAMHLSKLADAKEAFERALRLMPRNADIRSNYAVALIEYGDFEGARKQIDKMGELAFLGSADRAQFALRALLERRERERGASGQR